MSDLLAMKTKTFTARYLDSGFYIISDKAAGALCASLELELPRHGYCRDRMPLTIGEHTGSATLQRTDIRHSMRTDIPARGWVWALYAFRDLPVTLRGEFTFSPVAQVAQAVTATS